MIDPGAVPAWRPPPGPQPIAPPPPITSEYERARRRRQERKAAGTWEYRALPWVPLVLYWIVASAFTLEWALR